MDDLMKFFSILIAAISLATLANAAKPDRWKELTEPQLAAISKATAQVTPQIKPTKRKRVLLCTYAQGFWHNSIPWGAKALELMGQRTGAFEIVVAEDPSVFTAENLATFDAIAVNNVTGIDRWITDETARKAFIDFVRNGGGLFANHSASDGGWKEYSDLLGGRFDGHPWNAGGEWCYQVEEPNHALCNAFSNDRFQLKDEIYQLKDHFSRDTHRVLVSLDMSDEATDATRGKGGKRGDRDYAVSLIRSFGKGRVFYSVFGHREDVHTNPMMLQHYFDGMQYVLGDLKVDDRPVDLFTRLQRFHVGRNYEVELAYRGKIRDAAPEHKAQLESDLLRTLQGDATYDAKHFALDVLPLVWSAKSIPVLQSLFTDPMHNQRALENYRIATRVFKSDAKSIVPPIRESLTKADDDAKIGLINALALEKDGASVSALAKHARSPNRAVANAAVMAMSQLGELGLEALLEVPSAAAIATKRYDAIFTAIEGLSDNSRAAATYRQFLGEDKPAHVRNAAIRGLAQRDPKSATPVMADAIAKGPAEWRRAAMMTAAGMADSVGTKLLVAAPKSLGEAEHATLVTALRTRADDACRSRLREIVATGPLLAAEMAIDALAKIGTEADAKALVSALSRKDVGEHVVDTLASTGISGTEQALLAATQSADPAGLEALCETFRKRRSTAAAKRLMELRQHEDAKVSREAWRALAFCATPEQLPALLASLKDISSRDATRAQTVLVAIGKARNDDAEMVKDLAAAAKSANSEGRSAILGTVASFQNEQALAILRSALSDDQLRKDAVKALANWQSTAPIKDLLETASATDDRATRILALRGVGGILAATQAETANADVDAYYDRAFATAKEPDALVGLLIAIAEHSGMKAQKLATNYLDHADDNVFAKAWEAVSKLHRGGGSKPIQVSHGENSIAAMTDANQNSRWSTGTPMKPGMSLSVNLGKPTKLTSIVLDNSNPAGASRNDYPREPKLLISENGSDWKPVKAKIETGVKTTFSCDETATAFKIVVGKAAPGNYWSVHELFINSGAKASASVQEVPRDAITVSASARPKQAAKAIDGNDRSFWETGAVLNGKEWFELSFAAPKAITRITVDSKRRSDMQARGFALSLSPDGKRWTPPLLARDGGTMIDVSVYPAPVKKVRILQTKRDKKHKWAIGEITLYEKL
jgi:type 1 glutamine amidotransferase